MTDGGSSATAASSATVRSAPVSIGSALPGTLATAAAQTSCGHVLDHALAVEGGRLLLYNQAARVDGGDPVGHLEDFFQFVGDAHPREPPVAEPLDQVEHLPR